MTNQYRQRVPVCEGVKYDGTNAEEIMGFAPDNVSIEGGKLVWRTPPNIVMEVAEGCYVYKDTSPGATGLFNYAGAQDFENQYEPST